MKILFVIRHAKSNQRFWGNDFERPLNERGTADAPLMAARLKEKNIKIDAWISSPAKRAKKTAEAFAGIFNIPAENIILISALYHASHEVYYEVIRSLPASLNTVVIFSHNPGITYFVNSLVSDVKIDNMPTCGIFAVSCKLVSWAEFSNSKKEFLYFDYPKKE